MSTVNWSAIYLGNMADLDTDESDRVAEGAGTVPSSFGSSGDPLSDYVITLETNSNDGNTRITRDNDATTDTITYETSPGGATQTSTLDTIFNASLNVVFADGSDRNLSGFNIVQDTEGNLFLLASDFAFSGDTGSKAIDSISILSLNDGSNFSVKQDDVDGGSFVSTSSGPTICFASHTRIATPLGEVAAGHLRAGDEIMTLDNGAQPILWVARQRMRFRRGRDAFKPYRFPKGVLGKGLPRRALDLSKQHRLLLRAGGGEHLAPAVGFAMLDGIAQMPAAQDVTFINFLLPGHQIIFAEGAPVESLYLGPNSLAILSKPARREIEAAIGTAEFSKGHPRRARPFLTRRQTATLLRQEIEALCL
jgi:hypothetical protein